MFFFFEDRAISRIEAINFLVNQEQSGILVTNVIGLRTLLPNQKVYQHSQLTFEVGMEYSLAQLVKQLTNIGYQKVSQVINPGEFSRRGDILDIYEITEENPYRIEFLVMK